MGQVEYTDVITDKSWTPVRVHGHHTSLNSGTAREESCGAKNNSDPPCLMHTIEPAVSSSHHSGSADEGTTANTGSIETDDGDEKTSLVWVLSLSSGNTSNNSGVTEFLLSSLDPLSLRNTILHQVAPCGVTWVLNFSRRDQTGQSQTNHNKSFHLGHGLNFQTDFTDTFEFTATTLHN